MSAALLRINADRELVLALWERPRAVPRPDGLPRLMATEVDRRRVEPDEGAAVVELARDAEWGALFDPAVPEGEPPLLIGAFRVTGGEQSVSIVDTRGGPALDGDGVMKLLGPQSFDSTVNEMNRAVAFNADDFYAPPFALWWAYEGPLVGPAAVKQSSGQPAPTLPGALQFVLDDPECGEGKRLEFPGRRVVEFAGAEVREFPTGRVVAHAPGARELPERRRIPAFTRWVIATARDGARLIVLALRDPISEADRAVDLMFVEPGEAPTPWNLYRFERWYPDAREEMELALAAASKRWGGTTSTSTSPNGCTGMWTADRRRRRSMVCV